jgi:predicted amidohydrolase
MGAARPVCERSGGAGARAQRGAVPAVPCRYQEKFYFSPGDTGFKVWDTKFGRLGAGICWDQWFPECARSMALMGAEVRAAGVGARPPAGLPGPEGCAPPWPAQLLNRVLLRRHVCEHAACSPHVVQSVQHRL